MTLQLLRMLLHLMLLRLTHHLTLLRLTVLLAEIP